MAWNGKYDGSSKSWGEGPSELGRIALAFLLEHPDDVIGHRILDVGCGYGRDSMFLADALKWPVLGIDLSSEAIGMAKESAAQRGLDVCFEQMDLKDLKDRRFDVVLAANIYQVLRPVNRDMFIDMVRRVLKPGGLLFLNTLSIDDKEEYGKGQRVIGEPHSFISTKYLHFCTEVEIREAFGLLEIQKLFELSFDEPHQDGPTHHHTAWILIAKA